MSKKIAVVSLKFAPGHAAHLRAYRGLFQELGLETVLFLTPAYKNFLGEDSGLVYTDDIQPIADCQPDLVFIHNISTKNLSLLSLCRQRKIRSAYVLHEPRGSVSELLAEGRDLVKTVGANTVNWLICRKADLVLLCSETGLKNYRQYMKGCNPNARMLPLFFPDDYDADKAFDRKYFSFIGGFTDVHACREFLDLMEYALAGKMGIRFRIATRTNLGSMLEKDVFRKAIASGDLVVQAGRPMSNEEINAFYRESICVWNAYNRSTQSGVLACALMQGAPVLVNQNGAAGECVTDGETGYYISWPMNKDEILEKYGLIAGRTDEMSLKCREAFLKRFWYGNRLEETWEVLNLA